MDATVSNQQVSSQALRVLCDGCQTPMQVYLQPGDGYFEDAWYATCENRGCPLCGYTFSVKTYPPPNIERYRVAGRERLEAEA